jgi:ATP-dependent RNA helicase SUPV3L1/SUV3
LPYLRRQLNKDPQLSFKSNRLFSNFIFAIEAVKDKENVKGLGMFKAILYDGIIQLATTQFPDDIVLYKSLLSASDLRVPSEWYPQARLRKRRFIYHGGPTNSGKTYQALKRLREAGEKGGLYCGPLRLLALEVYESMTRQGIYCDLMTGQEKRSVPESTHVSCTVELVSVTREFDVAVVDEIQMVGNNQRGHAWTRAIQGLLANEIHICGGLEAVESVRDIVEEMGDSFELVKYERLSPLV